MPTEGKALFTESTSSATATPAEGGPQAFGSPSALLSARIEAQTAQTAVLDQATSHAAPTSTWDQLWDEGFSDVHDEAAADSPPAESATQSASVVLTQHLPASNHQAEASVPSSQHIMPSQEAMPPVVQQAGQSEQVPSQPAASRVQLPGHPSELSIEALPADSARTLPRHASASLQHSNALPEQAGPSQLISSWPGEATTPRTHTKPNQATSSFPKGSGVGVSGACVTPKTVGAREYGSWWTPPLPRGLTPAWLKVKTPAWVKKMRQMEVVLPLPTATSLHNKCMY